MTALTFGSIDPSPWWPRPVDLATWVVVEGTGATATIEVRFGTASHTGLVRDLNEDRLLASTPVFVVADGMGGHEAGEVASSVTVERFLPFLGRADVTRDEVAKAIADANAEVRRRSEGIIDGIGTTLAGLVVVDGVGGAEFLGINVGDSRVYRLRAGRMEQLSVDHSYVQELLSAGRITRGEADSHPQRNVITRAVGVDPEVEPDLWTISPDPGERYLVSSDGLHGEVDAESIAGVLRGVDDCQVAADELLRLALESGGRDNVSVIVLDVIGTDTDLSDTSPPAPVVVEVPLEGVVVPERPAADEIEQVPLTPTEETASGVATGVLIEDVPSADKGQS